MVSAQVKWVASHWSDALEVKGFMAKLPNGQEKKMLWLRGFHYYLVSLPHDIRSSMPSKGSATKMYENTKQQYKKLSELCKKARLAGLIDENEFFDNRNDFMVEAEERQRFKLNYYDYNVSAGDYFSFWLDNMRDFEDFYSGVSIDPIYDEDRFSHQLYEGLVITEKLTVKEVIEPICQEFGFNDLVVKGQSSFTRITDICKKAERTNRPILVVGIYDLDCAGWDMLNAVANSIQERYPHNNHKFVRVALTREQVEEYDLPTAFEPDDKGYPEVQKERFYEETGGRTCVELDALDNRVIAQLLRETLEQYDSRKLDKIAKRRIKAKIQREIDYAFENVDIEQHRDRYGRIEKQYKKFYEDGKKFKEYFKAKYQYFQKRVEKIEEDIKSDLEEMME